MTNATERRPARLDYRPDLDGVRALAVLAVLGFHVNYHQPVVWALFGGGFLGVDVFFVLSGLLITQLLLSEWAHRGTMNFRGFYERRARRLLPGLIALLLIYGTVSTVWHHDTDALAKTLLSELAYVNVAHLVGPWSLSVGHTWTLIVEWEFYFVWPLVMLWTLRHRSPRALLQLTVGLVLADALLRAAIFAHAHDAIFTYHVAWLRVDELLIGSLVAQLGPRLRVPGWVRTIGLLVILVAISRSTYTQSWLYYGGMTLLAVSTAAVIAPYDADGGWWGRKVLSTWPLPWIGRISYSLYLWSVPVGVEILNDTKSWPKPLRIVTAVVLSFVLASVSYYLIEKTFRRNSRRALATSPSYDGVDKSGAVRDAHAAESGAL